MIAFPKNEKQRKERLDNMLRGKLKLPSNLILPSQHLGRPQVHSLTFLLLANVHSTHKDQEKILMQTDLFIQALNQMSQNFKLQPVHGWFGTGAEDFEELLIVAQDSYQEILKRQQENRKTNDIDTDK